MSDEPVASEESTFWDQRYDLDLAPITEADLDERAVGRGRHLVLLAHITDEEVVSDFAPVLQALGEFDCFAPVPSSNLHITVKVIGNVVDDPDGAGQFSAQEENDLVSSLGSTLTDCQRFSIAFQRLNLFPSVVYAEVDDNGRFKQLNEAICEIEMIPVWNRDQDGYIPHLTVGQFTQHAGYERLLTFIEENRDLDVSATTVEELRLVALDLSEGRSPPYETIERYSLTR